MVALLDHLASLPGDVRRPRRWSSPGVAVMDAEVRAGALFVLALLLCDVFVFFLFLLEKAVLS